MEIVLNTRYDVGDFVLVKKDFKGKIVGIVVTIKPVPEVVSNALLADKKYLIDVDDEIIEVEEQYLEKYNS